MEFKPFFTSRISQAGQSCARLRQPGPLHRGRRINPDTWRGGGHLMTTDVLQLPLLLALARGLLSVLPALGRPDPPLLGIRLGLQARRGGGVSQGWPLRV